jgi:hypothetical protein
LKTTVKDKAIADIPGPPARRVPELMVAYIERSREILADSKKRRAVFGNRETVPGLVATPATPKSK